MKHLVIAPIALLAGACTQQAVLGDGGGAGGWFDIGGSGPEGAAGAGALAGGADGGSPASDPMAIGAEICEKRATCEVVEDDCAHDTGCIFTIFREELYQPLDTCLSNCGSLEACWQAAVAGTTPPDEFALYVSVCNQRGVECEGEPGAMGPDWCEYDFFSAKNYAAMVDCFDVSCEDINDCLRSVVYANEPSCFDF
jgi:hypothetical protein